MGWSEQDRDTGILARTGIYGLAVRQDSSSFQLPRGMEHTISLDKDHSNLVKYSSPQDNDYRKVFKTLNQLVKDASDVGESTFSEGSQMMTCII